MKVQGQIFRQTQRHVNFVKIQLTVVSPQHVRRAHPRIYANNTSNRTDDKFAEANDQAILPENIALTTITRAVVATALFTAFTNSISSPAYATEWHPRRHTRRIKDEALQSGIRNRAKLQEASSRAALQDKQGKLRSEQRRRASQASTRNDLSEMLSSTIKSIKRSVGGGKKQSHAPVFSTGISGGQPDPAGYYYSSPTSSVGGSYLGWWVVGIALMGVLYAKWGDFIQRIVGLVFQNRGRNGENGRWVRDRSLGGKLVFVPDANKNSRSPRPLWPDDDEFSSELATAASAQSTRASSIAPPGTNSSAIQDTNITPAWWAPPAPVSYVSKSRKEELTKQAKVMLRSLEDAKLRGQDYSLYSLVALRKLCHDGGGITVKANTESGRDALLRAAVRFSFQAILRPSAASELGGYEPGRFVSGLATDLGVPERRAITITHGEVAATCRSCLIDAEAAFRSGNQEQVLYALGRMVATLSAFPLPPKSAEAELVGRTIQAQTTLEFRRAVFLAAGSANINVAPTIAEMLGFDPGQVMEQLKMQIAMANNDDVTAQTD